MYMNKLLLIILFLSMSLYTAHAQNAHYATWMKYIESHETSKFNNVIYDGSDIIVNGYWFLDGEFDGIELPYHVASNGLIMKMDTTGKVIWNTKITGDGYESFFDMVMDSENNIILAGWSTSNELVEVNGKPVFVPTKDWTTRGTILKISGQDGSLIWYKTFYSDVDYSGVNATKIATDDSSNIYVAGYYDNSFLMDDLSFVYDQKNYGTSPFIAKLDKNGKTIWGQTFSYQAEESSGWITPRTLLVNDDKLYFAFEYVMPLIVNGKPLDYNGFYNWIGLMEISCKKGIVNKVSSFGSESNQGVTRLTMDYAGNFIMSGYYDTQNPITFGDFTLSGKSGNNGYVVKMNSDFTPIWAKSIGNEVSSSIFDIEVDYQNNLILGGGYYSGNHTTFNTDTIAYANTKNNVGLFVMKLDPDGKYKSSLTMAPNNEYGMVSLTDASAILANEIIMVGAAVDSVQFLKDVNESFYSHHNSGFVLRLKLFDVTSPTSVQVNATKNIMVYPNPNKGQLTIDTNHEIDEIEIYTLTGKLVKNFTGPSVQNTIAFHDLPNGTYIIKVKTAETTYSNQIIINK